MRTYRVIWNPAAGSKPLPPTTDVDRAGMLDLMARHHLGDDLVQTASEGDARVAARAAVADGVDIVVTAGGDGTIGVVAAELLHLPVALGVLPLGSVMNIPRMLGIPTDLEAAAAVLAEAPIRPIDVGRTRDRFFFEAGSVGMNAVMFREAQRFGDGDWLSILRSVWVALRYRPARMRLELDDQSVDTRALMVTASNGPYTGVGMTVAPEANLDDGLFDVRVFRGFSKVELVRHLASIAFGRRRYAPHASTFRSRRLRVSGARALPCRADSHDLGTTPIEFVALPGALRVVAPELDPGPAPTPTQQTLSAASPP